MPFFAFLKGGLKMNFRRRTNREEKKEEVEEVEITLDDKTVAELKDLAREKEIKGFSNMNKAELVEVLEGV